MRKVINFRCLSEICGLCHVAISPFSNNICVVLRGNVPMFGILLLLCTCYDWMLYRWFFLKDFCRVPHLHYSLAILGNIYAKAPIVFEPTQFSLAFSSKTGMSISRQSSPEGTFAVTGLWVSTMIPQLMKISPGLNLFVNDNFLG